MFESSPVVKRIFWINIIFYICRLIFEPIGIPVIEMMALYPFKSDNFHFYQLITHLFTHANFLHILFNMLVLLSFGPQVEKSLSTKQFTYFYLITGLIAASLQMLFTTNPLVGASGAIYGLFIYFVLLNPNSDLYIFGLIRVKAKYLATFIVMFELYSAFFVESNIGNFAHLGGIITGAVFFLSRKFK